VIDESLWRIVRGFCCDHSGNPRAIDAFGRLLDDDQEEVIRRRVRKWNDEALETLCFLITSTVDTIDNPDGSYSWIQCQGLYLTGTGASLRGLGKQEIPQDLRVWAVARLPKKVKDLVIPGSHIVPVTWVHGFSWKQWREGLAQEAAMYQKASPVLPVQAEEAQAWMWPLFVRKEIANIDWAAIESESPVTQLGKSLSKSLRKVLQQLHGKLPEDVCIHPITAPAHSCWTHGKVIAFYDWLSAGMAAAASHHKKVYPVEAPSKGSVQFRLAGTDQVLVELRADPSFPVDGTGLVISTLLGSRVA
jgi:hypothetical protein